MQEPPQVSFTIKFENSLHLNCVIVKMCYYLNFILFWILYNEAEWTLQDFHQPFMRYYSNRLLYTIRFLLIMLRYYFGYMSKIYTVVYSSSSLTDSLHLLISRKEEQCPYEWNQVKSSFQWQLCRLVTWLNLIQDLSYRKVLNNL